MPTCESQLHRTGLWCTKDATWIVSLPSRSIDGGPEWHACDYHLVKQLRELMAPYDASARVMRIA